MGRAQREAKGARQLTGHGDGVWRTHARRIAERALVQDAPPQFTQEMPHDAQSPLALVLKRRAFELLGLGAFDRLRADGVQVG